MNEIRELVDFMRSGKRKEMYLEDYLSIKRRTKKWTRKRECILLNQLEKSSVISVNYKRVGERIRKNLILNA